MHRAGVSGLSTDLEHSKNPAYSVIILAKHMPGDFDAECASLRTLLGDVFDPIQID